LMPMLSMAATATKTLKSKATSFSRSSRGSKKSKYQTKKPALAGFLLSADQ
jgi:hypothetical protein